MPYGAAALYFALLASMILAVYLRPIWLCLIPAAAIFWIWIEAMQGMPQRAAAFLALSLGLFAVHFLLCKRYFSKEPPL